MILDCVHHGGTNQRRDGHARCGGDLLFRIDGFRVLTGRGLHGDGLFQRHFLDTAAIGFQSGKLTADHVCAAWPGHNRRDSRFTRLFKTGIEWIQSIDRAKLRCDWIGHFVAVGAFFAHAVLPHADMAVRINESRQNKASVQLNDRCAFGCNGGRDGGDFSVFNKNITGKGLAGHGMKQTVSKQ